MIKPLDLSPGSRPFTLAFHWISFLFLLFMIPGARAQEVSVALYYHRPVGQMIFTPVDAGYDVIIHDSTLATLPTGSTAYLSAVDSAVMLYLPGRETIRNHEIILQASDTTDKGRFRLRPVSPEMEEHRYPGTLLLKAVDTILLPVNRVNREMYVAAVTEAEGGGKAPAAFVQAQAILVRTFLAGAGERHVTEGFDLCDGVHCQAYHGISDWFERIYEISSSTRGEILTDKNGIPLRVAYHSNSGGQTADAKDVWLVSVPYLKPVKDPWSLKGKHAHWKKTIPLAVWRSAIVEIGYPQASRLKPAAFNYQSQNRLANYPLGTSQIPFRLIREKLDLPSAWFSVTVKGNQVILNGHGYGHGLGLSQEGAMEMAKEGFTAKEILEFYLKVEF